MSYKVILIGMLLPLAMPLAASAAPDVFFVGTISGTMACPSNNGAPVKIKEHVEIQLTGPSMIIANNLQDPFSNGLSLITDQNATSTGSKGGAFSYSQINGVFAGTYTGNSLLEATSITGSIVGTFDHGCVKIATIKVKVTGSLLP